MAVKGKRADKKPAKRSASKGGKSQASRNGDAGEAVKVSSEQSELPGMPKNEPELPAIAGNVIRAEYVAAHYSKGKSGARLVGMEFSFALTDDHDGMLPGELTNHWLHINDGGIRSIGGIEIEPQAMKIYAAPNTPAALTILYAEINKAGLSTIKETGTGKSKSVTRFSFRATVPVRETVSDFADNNFGNTVWLEMQKSQHDLPLDQDDEEPADESSEE